MHDALERIADAARRLRHATRRRRAPRAAARRATRWSSSAPPMAPPPGGSSSRRRTSGCRGTTPGASSTRAWRRGRPLSRSSSSPARIGCPAGREQLTEYEGNKMIVAVDREEPDGLALEVAYRLAAARVAMAAMASSRSTPRRPRRRGGGELDAQAGSGDPLDADRASRPAPTRHAPASTRWSRGSRTLERIESLIGAADLRRRRWPVPGATTQKGAGARAASRSFCEGARSGPTEERTRGAGRLGAMTSTRPVEGDLKAAVPARGDRRRWLPPVGPSTARARPGRRTGSRP